MRKKVDLNAPRQTNTNIKQHHNNRPNITANNQMALENNSQTPPADNSLDNIKNLGNLGKQKVIEEGLKSAGVPASIASWASKQKRVQAAADNHMPKGIVKFAMKSTMTLSIVLMMAAPIVLLMLFVVLFGASESSSSSSGAGSGTFTYGQTCEMITVYNTGCDGNAQNCSNAYDGTVTLEDYVAGVVTAEIGPAPNDLEYYKVVAIAARSYVLNHISSSCRVPGNATFQAYMHSGNELIKQAAEETKGLVLVKDGQIVDAEFSSACVVNADENDYWIRYGSKTLGKPNIQKVPKEWDHNESAFKDFLAYWYSMVDKSNTNYETKACPNNHDNGMSQLGALYLTTKENYSSEEVIKYYYGDEIKILKTEMQLPGVNGFINPTKTINCTSPFGMRTHPVTGEMNSFHNGLDIAVDEPIYAAKSGTISSVTKNITIINATESNEESGFGAGNNIVIDHGDGTSTVYMHIKYGSIPDRIYEGATVEQGEKIGHTGSTGRSTGVHLHYGVKVNGQLVDPSDYLNLTNATGTCIHE